MKNNKGLSTVVTTLIIILLVLVAVGIIWGVVNNLLGKSSGTIETSTKCLDVDVRATKVTQGLTSTSYNVTLYRAPTGDSEVGAKVVFVSDTENSGAIEFGTTLEPLDRFTRELPAGIANATSVEVTTYFEDDSGKEKFCPITTTFDFELA
jgi:hypothetical protein